LFKLFNQYYIENNFKKKKLNFKKSKIDLKQQK